MKYNALLQYFVVLSSVVNYVKDICDGETLSFDAHSEYMEQNARHSEIILPHYKKNRLITKKITMMKKVIGSRLSDFCSSR